MSAYRTVDGEASAEIVIKKSRFLAFVFPLGEEGQATKALDTLRKRYYDASHHCYAYILGQNGAQMKYADDGEPQGTAGLPILEVLRKQGLTDVLVVVVRYFGGIKLGAGPLSRTYGTACAAAIEKAGICELIAAERLSIECPYPVYDRVERYILGAGLLVENSAFGETVRIVVLCQKERSAEVKRELLECSAGQINFDSLGETVIRRPRI